MILIADQWPNTLLVATLGILLVSVFLPWVFRRRHIFVIYLPAVVASAIWLVYENRQSQVFHEGNPLIYHLVFPLLLSTWVGANTAAAISLLNKIDKKNSRSMALYRPWTLTLSGVVLF